MDSLFCYLRFKISPSESVVIHNSLISTVVILQVFAMLQLKLSIVISSSWRLMSELFLKREFQIILKLKLNNA